MSTRALAENALLIIQRLHNERPGYATTTAQAVAAEEALLRAHMDNGLMNNIELAHAKRTLLALHTGERRL